MKKIAVLLLLLPACLWASDAEFGLALNQEVGYGGEVYKAAVDYAAALVPHFSTAIGNSGGLYISAGLTFSYDESEDFTVIPELLHTEFSMRFGDSWKLRAGRIPYSDPLDFVAEGFFDGAHVLYDTVFGTFNAGLFYSGLLYKRSANITMTSDEDGYYYEAVDYDDFSNTYFAPKHLLLTAGWEHPSIMEVMRLRAAITGQIDLNGTDYPYNSTYISGKAVIPLTGFVFRAGLCMEISTYLNNTGVGFAWELGTSWALSKPFAGRFSFDWRYSTGHWKNDNVVEFVPVTTKAQGELLQAKLSGLMGFFIDYTAQFSPNLSVSLTNSYFLRTDLGTYKGLYPVYETENKEHFLGTELFGRFLWMALSDLGLNLGGGIFIPSSGFKAKADYKWRVELGLALILY